MTNTKITCAYGRPFNARIVRGLSFNLSWGGNSIETSIILRRVALITLSVGCAENALHRKNGLCIYGLYECRNYDAEKEKTLNKKLGDDFEANYEEYENVEYEDGEYEEREYE